MDENTPAPGGAPAAAPPVDERDAKAIVCPSGNSVHLRDWHQLTRGDKRAVLAALPVGAGSAGGHDLTNGLLTLLVANWSYPYPLPSAAPGSLEMLPVEDDQALFEAVAPCRRALFPPEPTTPAEQAKAQADPSSPTTPAAG